MIKSFKKIYFHIRIMTRTLCNPSTEIYPSQLIILLFMNVKKASSYFFLFLFLGNFNIMFKFF